MPPIKKIPPKFWMYGAAVVVPILKAAGQALVEKFTTDPRTCPGCSYLSVAEVGRRKTRSAKSIHYWRCSACAARYRSTTIEGALSRPTERDWARHVRIHFFR